MLKKMLNSVGAWRQPCFIPLTMGKDPERSLFNLTWLRWSSSCWITMLRNFEDSQCAPWSSAVPFSSLCQTLWPGSQTLHKCSRHFSWSYLRTNTMSVVSLLDLNHHWVSGKWSYLYTYIHKHIFKYTHIHTPNILAYKRTVKHIFLPIYLSCIHTHTHIYIYISNIYTWCM